MHKPQKTSWPSWDKVFWLELVWWKGVVFYVHLSVSWLLSVAWWHLTAVVSPPARQSHRLPRPANFELEVFIPPCVTQSIGCSGLWVEVAWYFGMIHLPLHFFVLMRQFIVQIQCLGTFFNLPFFSMKISVYLNTWKSFFFFLHFHFRWNKTFQMIWKNWHNS